MKGSLIIVGFFLLGVVLAYYHFIPHEILENDMSRYALYCLMFLVGVSIGGDEKNLKAIRQQNWRVAALPIATILGTLLGAFVIGLIFTHHSISEWMAIGSGFGYYSLSSILITESKGAELGTISLMSNILREILTLLLAPLMVYVFGKLAPISAGGATTADTTLPIITKVSGKEFVVLSIFHGITVDLSVPFLVSLFLSM